MRLTKTLKEEILKNLMTATFKKPVEELWGKYKDFTQKVYEDVYTKNEIKTLETIPERWMQQTCSIMVMFATDKVDLKFNGCQFIQSHQPKTAMREERNLPYKHLYSVCKQYSATDELSEEYTDLSWARKDLKSKMEEAENSAKAALDSVTTVNALIKSWEEVKPYIPAHAFTKSQLPAIKVDDLNKKFELPKEVA